MSLCINCLYCENEVLLRLQYLFAVLLQKCHSVNLLSHFAIEIQVVNRFSCNFLMIDYCLALWVLCLHVNIIVVQSHICGLARESIYAPQKCGLSITSTLIANPFSLREVEHYLAGIAFAWQSYVCLWYMTGCFVTLNLLQNCEMSSSTTG